MDYVKKFNALEKTKKKLYADTTKWIVEYIKNKFPSELVLNLSIKPQKNIPFSFKIRFEHLNTSRNLYHMFISCGSRMSTIIYFRGNKKMKEVGPCEIKFDNIILNDTISFDVISNINEFKNSDFTELKAEIDKCFKNYVDLTFDQSLIYLNKFAKTKYGFESANELKKFIDDNKFINNKSPFFLKHSGDKRYILILVGYNNDELTVEHIDTTNSENILKNTVKYNINSLFDVNSEYRIDSHVFHFFKHNPFNLIPTQEVENIFLKNKPLEEFKYKCLSILKSYLKGELKHLGYYHLDTSRYSVETRKIRTIFDKYMHKITSYGDSHDYPYPIVELSDVFSKIEIWSLTTHNYIFKNLLEYILKYHPNIAIGMNPLYLDFEGFYNEEYNLGRVLKNYYEKNNIPQAIVKKIYWKN